MEKYFCDEMFFPKSYWSKLYCKREIIPSADGHNNQFPISPTKLIALIEKKQLILTNSKRMSELELSDDFTFLVYFMNRRIHVYSLPNKFGKKI